jgi:hypothetical protein
MRISKDGMTLTVKGERESDCSSIPAISRENLLHYPFQCTAREHFLVKENVNTIIDLAGVATVAPAQM